MNELYQKYKEELSKIADIKGAAALMQWDQEVYMPENSHLVRAQQIATLTSLAHEFFSNPQLKEIIEKLINTLPADSKEIQNVKVSYRDIEKQSKLSNNFINELSKKVSASFDAWQKAYKSSDFLIFKPYLEDLVKLKQQECEIIGYQNHPYDVLLDDFDRGLTVAKTDEVFGQLKGSLQSLLAEILEVQDMKMDFLSQSFHKDFQWEIGKKICNALGFSFLNGRKDLSTHPFTVSMACSDVRITTRIDENNFMEMLWSTIHEVGHALYEQGLNHDDYGLPSGEATSLSIHESQSRLYENNIGKSRAFLYHYWPMIADKFKHVLQGIKFDDFLKTVNYVQPSLIRTNADEVTYHFHIIIRYEIEKALIDGSIKVKDLPDVWNEKYLKYLGIKPSNDREGVLQDVHWSHGSFGYFPTYTLGSLYAAQFFNTINSKTSDLDKQIEVADYNVISQWLNENIYSKGRLFDSDVLCQKACGEPLNSIYFINYIQSKYKDIYSSNTILKTSFI
jgi:carboxypeptidase Taq